MAVRKYYEISRRERKRYRKRMMAALKKYGYADEEILRVTDSMAGRTLSGKEAAARDILAMLSDGAEKRDVFAYLEERLREDRFPYAVR